MKRLRALPNRIRLYGLLAVYVLVVSFPFYYMVLTSLRTQKDVYNKEGMLTPVNLILDNYGIVLGSTNMTTWVTNSVFVGVASSAIALVIGTLAAYSLARLRFFGSNALARSVLFMYLVPSSLLFIPLYLIIANLGLLNSLWALILTYQTFNVPFCTWMLLGYFRTIPMELEDAARIDGCSRLGVLGRIILPLSAPGLVTAFIFSFTNSWNEFLYAAVMATRSELKTIPVGLYSFQIADILLWGQLMAAAILATAPVLVLYMLVQRFVVQGLTAGSVKG
ncbi:MAG TPA: carbohydrate ABC transporter permease [Thermoflexales bacterium]|nr:carbohydrate ABC transporter permease [Anaerolineae bacterium]HQV29772.1 carbohydrate ABC transporter permease [Thermoflexales bacterium]HQX10043.1 carbohydrate ABC transporter permease [Thermoflexales bacterium]HQY25900.1 carbohydrate ABC transporter permease [Thermoflexales bacterium]HQZ55155.1 carbohydrate ABC transporter permease [Thermoflexales bacterium]